MLSIKEISNKEIIFIDENKKEYKLTCSYDQEFDRDVVEDIIDWAYRTEKKANNE